MRRFLITSNKFAGQVEVVYNDELLSSMDFGGSKCTAAQIKVLKDGCTVFVNDIEKAFGALPIMVVEAGFAVNFEMFWKEYPYKRNRHLAEEYFNKLQVTAQVQAWQAAKDYSGYCKREAWYKMKIADTWLKKREYLNDWKKL